MSSMNVVAKHKSWIICNDDNFDELKSKRNDPGLPGNVNNEEPVEDQIQQPVQRIEEMEQIVEKQQIEQYELPKSASQLVDLGPQIKEHRVQEIDEDALYRELDALENISELIDADVDNQSIPVGPSVRPNLSNNAHVNDLISRLKEFGAQNYLPDWAGRRLSKIQDKRFNRAAVKRSCRALSGLQPADARHRRADSAVGGKSPAECGRVVNI